MQEHSAESTRQPDGDGAQAGEHLLELSQLPTGRRNTTRLLPDGRPGLQEQVTHQQLQVLPEGGHRSGQVSRSHTSSCRCCRREDRSGQQVTHQQLQVLPEGGHRSSQVSRSHISSCRCCGRERSQVRSAGHTPAAASAARERSQVRSAGHTPAAAGAARGRSQVRSAGQRQAIHISRRRRYGWGWQHGTPDGVRIRERLEVPAGRRTLNDPIDGSTVIDEQTDSQAGVQYLANMILQDYGNFQSHVRHLTIMRTVSQIIIYREGETQEQSNWAFCQRLIWLNKS